MIAVTAYVVFHKVSPWLWLSTRSDAMLAKCIIHTSCFGTVTVYILLYLYLLRTVSK